MKNQAFPIYELVKEISKISFSDVIAALTFGRPSIIAVAFLVSVYTIISIATSRTKGIHLYFWLPAVIGNFLFIGSYLQKIFTFRMVGPGGGGEGIILIVVLLPAMIFFSVFSLLLLLRFPSRVAWSLRRCLFSLLLAVVPTTLLGYFLASVFRN